MSHGSESKISFSLVNLSGEDLHMVSKINCVAWDTETSPMKTHVRFQLVDNCRHILICNELARKLHTEVLRGADRRINEEKTDTLGARVFFPDTFPCMWLAIKRETKKRAT